LYIFIDDRFVEVVVALVTVEGGGGEGDFDDVLN